MNWKCFFGHDWRIERRGEARCNVKEPFSREYIPERVSVQIHKCAQCGKRRAVIYSASGGHSIPVPYAEAQFEDVR